MIKKTRVVLQLGQFGRRLDQNAQQGAEVRSRQELPAAASQTAAQDEGDPAGLAAGGEDALGNIKPAVLRLKSVFGVVFFVFVFKNCICVCR